MKTTLLITAFIIASKICKGQILSPSAGMDPCFTTGYIGKRGTVDSACKVDGVTTYYLFNKKVVPMGIYTDFKTVTTTWQGRTIYHYEYRCFYNRISIFESYAINEYTNFYTGGYADTVALKTILNLKH